MAIAGIVMAGVGSASIGAAHIALTLQALGEWQRRISTLRLLLGRHLKQSHESARSHDVTATLLDERSAARGQGQAA
jgi:hypothetical protein